MHPCQAAVRAELARACRIKPDTPATLRCWATNSFRLVLWLWRPPNPSLPLPNYRWQIEVLPQSRRQRQTGLACRGSCAWQLHVRQCRWQLVDNDFDVIVGAAALEFIHATVASSQCIQCSKLRIRHACQAGVNANAYIVINQWAGDDSWQRRKSHSQPCKPSMKAKGFVMELASWQSIKRRDLSPTPQLCKLRFVFFTNQAMIWLHVLSNIKDSLHNEGNVFTA